MIKEIKNYKEVTSLSIQRIANKLYKVQYAYIINS